jgi:hypothetical protein
MAIMAGVLNLKGIALAGLLQAQKLILASDQEVSIDPKFRIMTPEGDFLISITLANDPCERGHQLQQISRFMAWKRAWVFTVAGQLMNPDAVFCFGATHLDQIGTISTIERSPVRFGNPEWLEPKEIAGEILALLPRGEAALKAADLADLDIFFGPEGKFPALRLGDGGQWPRTIALRTAATLPA